LEALGIYDCSKIVRDTINPSKMLEAREREMQAFSKQK
jgi:hypothetical protein